MRVSWLSVSDQLGGSERVLLTMLRGVRDARPDWTSQVVLPGSGPLRERVEDTGAACVVVPMPPALARVGESAAAREGWNTAATIALGLRLGAGAVALPAYEARLARTLSSFGPDIIHTNGLKAHLPGARSRLQSPAVVWHLHEYVSRRRVTRWLMRRYARHCGAIIANSASVASDIGSVIDAPPPVHVV